MKDNVHVLQKKIVALHAPRGRKRFHFWIVLQPVGRYFNTGVLAKIIELKMFIEQSVHAGKEKIPFLEDKPRSDNILSSLAFFYSHLFTYEIAELVTHYFMPK